MILARMITLEEADKFDKLLQGEDVTICQEVNPDADCVMPEIKYSEELAKYAPHKVDELEHNQEATRNANAFFMLGDDLQETLHNLAICANQPQSEDAVNGVNINRDSFFARGAVAIYVFEVPDEDFQSWLYRGLAGVNEANENYETRDGAKIELQEAVLGDIAIKEAITKGYLTHFGQSHKVYEAAGLSASQFDPNNVFDRSFVPQNPVGMEHTQTTSTVENTNCPYTDPTLIKMYNQIVSASISKSQKAELLETLEYLKNLDAEAREFTLPSIQETIDAYTIGMDDFTC